MQVYESEGFACLLWPRAVMLTGTSYWLQKIGCYKKLHSIYKCTELYLGSHAFFELHSMPKLTIMF